MRIDVLSIFPQMFSAVLAESMLAIARGKGLLVFHAHDIRAWTQDKHGKVDDKPFGGGPGMVLRCQPVVDAVAAVRAMASPPGRLIFLTPEGRRFDQECAMAYARAERLILVCGRYEGFDQRIFDILQPELLSVGDFVLSGGEIAAMAVIEAVARLIPGVLGNGESLADESFRLCPDPERSGHLVRLLDYPHYTQPADFRGHLVPEVLRSGNHAAIAVWRQAQAWARTRALRPDLLAPQADKKETNGK